MIASHDEHTSQDDGTTFLTLGQGEADRRQQLVMSHAYYIFCLPHARLRQPLVVPEPTNRKCGNGLARKLIVT